MHAQKPQNINDQISIVEILLGELHAKLPRSSQDSVPCHDQAQLVWRAPEGPNGLAVVPVGGGRAWSRLISHAIPPRHGLTHAQKPQNINDQISIVEILLGELHAKLPRSSQDSVPCHDQAQLVWRASEGLEGLAAVPVGGGRAWPGFETARRAEGSQRGRLAGGPPPTGTPSSPAQRAARPHTPTGGAQRGS